MLGNFDFSLYFYERHNAVEEMKYFKSLLPKVIVPDYVLMREGLERIDLYMRESSKFIIVDTRLFNFDNYKTLKTIQHICNEVDGITLDFRINNDFLLKILEIFYVKKSVNLNFFIFNSIRRFSIIYSEGNLYELKRLSDLGFNSFIIDEEFYKILKDKHSDFLANKNIFLDVNRKVYVNKIKNNNAEDFIDQKFIKCLGEEAKNFNFYINLIISEKNILNICDVEDCSDSLKRMVDNIIKYKA